MDSAPPPPKKKRATTNMLRPKAARVSLSQLQASDLNGRTRIGTFCGLIISSGNPPNKKRRYWRERERGKGPKRHFNSHWRKTETDSAQRSFSFPRIGCFGDLNPCFLQKWDTSTSEQTALQAGSQRSSSFSGSPGSPGSPEKWVRSGTWALQPSGCQASNDTHDQISLYPILGFGFIPSGALGGGNLSHAMVNGISG